MPPVVPAGVESAGAVAAGPLVGRRAVLRTGLLAGAASALAGCGLLDGNAVPFGPDDAPPDTGDLAAALADEERLLAAHLTAAERHPDLAPRLAGVRADHAEHRRVLRALLVDLDPEGPWAAPAGTSGPTPAGTSGTDAAVPRAPADALAALVDLERQAASARTEQAGTAALSWAPLLGVLAASEAAHAAVLGA